MMNDTTRSTIARRKRRRLALAIPAAFLSVNLSTSFCPVPVHHSHRRTSNRESCRRPWLALSSKNSEKDDSQKNSDNKVDSDNALLHQELKTADPEWYREYVSDLLGEDYCKKRWPEMELPFSARFIDETEDEPEESDNETDETETLPEGNLEAKKEILADVDDEEETQEVEDDEDETETLPQAKIETKETEEKSVDATRKLEEPDDEKETEEISAIVDDEKKVEVETETEDDEIETVGKSETEEESKEEPQKETRAVVYRSITGKKMTCVSLSGILKLGYSVSDLETIQAEFLSIVVLDQRKCPSMGVPAQWKIKGTQKPEIKLVDSMEEASAMVKEMNAAERAEKESIQERRRRQEGRQQTDDREARDDRRRRRSDDPERDSNRQVSRRRKDEPRRKDSRDERRRKRPTEEPPRRRKRERLDRNGRPRKIYKVPRDDTRSMADTRDDPPDPESPLWVNMDTFRNLLDREAGLRMWILGEDWSQVIEQEKDWRTDTYKNWLWMLNNGVGDSIVPPSRYERARKRNQQQGPPPPKRRRRDEPPRRRRDEPREESRRQRRKPPPQKQRRPKRKPPEDDEELDRVSASERRSRRRAERRRERPDNEP